MEQVDVRARFGSVIRTSTSPYRTLAVEVRVGDQGFDNSGFGGWQNGFRTASLPAYSTPESVATVAWGATDRAYKEAIEQYARKAAQVERDDDHPGDYTLAEPIAATLEGPSIGAAEPMVQLAEQLSAAMAVDPGTAVLELGEVYVGFETGSEVLVDTAGTRLIQPRSELTVRAVFQVRAPDGQFLTDERLWTVQGPEQLPPLADMLASTTQMATSVVDIANNAEVLDEEYVGPVLFEGEAALDLLRYVLVPQLEGTPDDVPFDSFFGDLGSRASGAARLSRRVLPLGWTVDDNPLRMPDHPGSYRFDAEGTPAAAVTLVEDGIVQDLLMSRTPRPDIRETNGHARGGFGERARGRPVAVAVTPDRNDSVRKVSKKARRLANAYDRDWIFVVTSLQEPSAMAVGDYSRYPNFDPQQPSLPPPVALIRRYQDGREETVRGAVFTGVQRFILRDIAAAGTQRQTSYLIDGTGDPAGFTPTGGLPTWMSGPDVLIGEMELVPTAGDPRSLPIVPAPTVTLHDLTTAP
ncbi:MAG: putative Zn-dependent protease [bacterium]|jgi:predicted Zn-dependent protease